jgi:hypothetical protein
LVGRFLHPLAVKDMETARTGQRDHVAGVGKHAQVPDRGRHIEQVLAATVRRFRQRCHLA